MEKPRAPDKTVRVIAEAHDAATKRAHEAGTDRKTIVSQAILVYCARSYVACDLSQLKARSIQFLIQTFDLLEEAPEEVSAERVAIFKIVIHELPGLAAIPEKSSSTNEHALASKLEEVSYPEPALLKEWNVWRESLAAGDRATK